MVTLHSCTAPIGNKSTKIMGYTRPTTTTKDFLVAAPLPNHGKTYTVIPHKDVIEITKTLLDLSGFKITKELYKANMNGTSGRMYSVDKMQYIITIEDERTQQMMDLSKKMSKHKRFK